jgi:hypothetical protein
MGTISAPSSCDITASALPPSNQIGANLLVDVAADDSEEYDEETSA